MPSNESVDVFLGIFVFDVPFPLIVVAAAAIGLVGGRLRPELFNLITGHDDAAAIDDADVLVGDQDISLGKPSLGRVVVVLVCGLGLWFGPVALLAAMFGRSSVYLDVAWFFSGAAVLTFGGAYSVLAYIS